MNMKSIYHFKKGDIITRIKPAKPLPITGMFGDITSYNNDRSHLGEKLTFIGIANSIIYLQRDKDKYIDVEIIGTDLINTETKVIKLLELPLDIFDEGWDFYFDPMNFFNDTIPVKDENTIEDIKEQLNSAILNEDYETANILKLKLNDIG